MNFKKKLIILSALVTVLAITYALILFLDSPRRRDPAFSWLDSSLHNMADRIELLGGQGLIVLNRINGIWHLTENNVNFPVRQGRIE
ncbi:MAG: hypothetical protein FWG77_07065, partial [Treponema sp.]|nr:hypothetical protein [Treponema sp.]